MSMTNGITQASINRLSSLYGDIPTKTNVGTDSLLIALLTFKFGRANAIFHEKLSQGGVQAVADNLEGVAVFV